MWKVCIYSINFFSYVDKSFVIGWVVTSNIYLYGGIFLKVIRIKRKNIIYSSCLVIAFLIIFVCSNSFGMQHYYKLDFSTGLVTATILNVRSGPGVTYNVVTTIKKNEYIRVFAGIGNWYIVQIEGDYVGAVSKDYIKPIKFYNQF